MSKSLDRHATKLEQKRKKACERLLRDVVQYSDHRLDDSDKAVLWDALIEEAKGVLK